MRHRKRFIPALVLVSCCAVVACSKAEAPAKTAKVTADQLALKVDPFCGMSMEKTPIAATYEYKGKTYGFCSNICKEGFEKDPEKYLAKVGQEK